MFVSPDPDAEQKVEIYMNTTIPASYGEDMAGFVVMNYISFQDYDDKEADPAKLVCKTTVDAPWAHAVHQYTPDNDLAAEAQL